LLFKILLLFYIELWTEIIAPAFFFLSKIPWISRNDYQMRMSFETEVKGNLQEVMISAGILIRR
jgi:hypothetical protein